MDQFIALALDRHTSRPVRIVLGSDATDDRVHGTQQRRFFHRDQRHYCYPPLHISWGDFPLVARLRTADQDGAPGSLEELQRVVAAIRARWPEVPIPVCTDSGFARNRLFDWCENNDAEVDGRGPRTTLRAGRLPISSSDCRLRSSLSLVLLCGGAVQSSRNTTSVSHRRRA